MARQATQLGFVGDAGLIELHQHRHLPVAFHAGQVKQQRFGFGQAGDGLHGIPQGQQGAFEAGQIDEPLLDRHPGQATAAEPNNLQLVVEEGQKFRARVVEDHDAVLAQEPIELLAEVGVQGVHGVPPALSW